MDKSAFKDYLNNLQKSGCSCDDSSSKSTSLDPDPHPFLKYTPHFSYTFPGECSNILLIAILVLFKKIFSKSKNLWKSQTTLALKNKAIGTESSAITSRRLRRINFVILILCELFLIQPVLPASHPVISFDEDFAYEQTDLMHGPNTWKGECASGRRQSPIDIRHKEFGTSWGGFTKFSFNKQYYKTHSGFFATNPGHTFQIQFSDARNLPISDLMFTGAGFRRRYTFAQLHFHWGDRDEVGSEHTLHGIRYPMEIHLVHFKSQYGNLTHALHEDTRDPEAVAVFAIFCELGEENPALSSIVAAAASPAVLSPTEELKPNYQNVNILDLLPRHLDFVRYLGSLTTPPCTEKVAWTVFLTPSTVSKSQLEGFRKLRDTKNDAKYYNYRPLQPRNGRKLKYYKVLRRGGGEGGEWGGNEGQDGQDSFLFPPLISPIMKIKDVISDTFQEVNSLISNFLTSICKSKYCIEES